jgi:hypothetical protein
MDRVLIAIDQIQFSSHLEMTLRKVGFDVEVITTEFNLSEKLLTFNPDIIIARGQSTKLSVLNIGKKLKDNSKYTGKVILILGTDQKISPSDLEKIKSDLLLFEPVGALKITLNILNMDPQRKELMLDRLLRMAEVDPQFRSVEQSYLVSHGHDLDREITTVHGKTESTDNQEFVISEDLVKSFASPDLAKDTVIDPVESRKGISDEAKAHINAELLAVKEELPLRIGNYNHQIRKLDLDLKKGLSKRQTKNQVKKHRAELMVDPGQDKLESLDQEKQRFAKALFKKK